MMNRVKVVLCGKEYLLQTEDAPSYVYQLAKNLEKRISDITENNPRVSAHSAVMMVALSTMDELTKANNSVEVIRSQVKEYVDEAGKARLERDAALREIDVLKAKIEQLENLNKLKSLRDSIQTDERTAKKPKKQEAAAETEQAAPAEDASEEQLSLTQPEA
ncbi:MAG: cell division protein ZapA [Oscillospiraceae bacterium]|nr:cell division protein ZapA [Oscillospiraceae bacterium]MCR4760781.1 cell division protein ZapA [Oscillospiraceae bacterium]